VLDRSFFSSQISLLQELLEEQFGLLVNIGAELEFYLGSKSNEESKSALAELSKKCSYLEKERGCNQHEAVFDYKHTLIELTERIEAFKNTAKKFDAIFDAKPFVDDYGSALHLHLSLHDNKGKNIFSTEDIAISQVLAGLIDIGPESVYLLCKNEEDYLRFTPKFLSPTHISWGGNNRTTMLRIPDSPKANKRIEFRLPSASSDPATAVYIVLLGTVHGLTNQLTPPPRIYGNAFDKQYKLPVIPKTLEEAKNAFEKGQKIMHYANKLTNMLQQTKSWKHI
jgi:glutamine synthetase